MQKLRFVHLSDIHFGQEHNGSVKIHDDVRAEVLNDCKRIAVTEGGADGIIICGDTAYSGKENEYGKASDWLECLAKVCGCCTTSILVVPGNHDVDLDGVIYPCECAHDQFRESSDEKIDELIEKYDSTEYGQSPILHKLGAYRQFAAQYGCDFQSTRTASWKKLFNITEEHKIVFVGMNTVLSSDKSDGPGKMVLGSRQCIIPREENVEYIVLMHHPIDWLRDKHRAESYICSRARLLLTGHEHRLQILQTCRDGGSHYIHICSGSANPNENVAPYIYRYNWIEIELKEVDTRYILAVKISPRKWNYSSTKFVVDADLTNCEQYFEAEMVCPNFVCKEKDRSTPVSLVEGEGGCLTNMASDSVLMIENSSPEFARLRYFFWKYLDWSARMKVLVQFDILPATKIQSLPQTIESVALGELAKRGLLSDAWEMIMNFVPEDKREANPFDKGDAHA